VDFNGWLKSLEDSGLANSLRGSLYYFPFLESVHVMALAVVFGTIVVVDLRVLGWASRNRPFTKMSSELLRLTWGAFTVSVLTGALMFTTNARVYAHNTAFQVKMLLLLCAGLNMAAFHLTAGNARNVAHWDTAPAAPGIGKTTAALSIVLWVGIIFTGRVIGFTTTGAQAKEAPAPVGDFDQFLNGAPASAPSATQAVGTR
jgi:hypothetical protein